MLKVSHKKCKPIFFLPISLKFLIQVQAGSYDEILCTQMDNITLNKNPVF